MLYKELILTEAKGVFGRKVDDKFVNQDGDELQFKSIEIFPSVNAGDQYPDVNTLNKALSQAIGAADAEIVNKKKPGDRAFAVAKLTWPNANQQVEVWVKFFNRVPKNLVGSWQNKEVPSGWKLATKTAAKARSGLAPQDLIKTDAALAGSAAIISTVAKNGASPEIVNGLKMAAAGKPPVFVGQVDSAEAIRDVLGEIVQPIAIMSGLVQGDIEQARASILGIPWNQCTVSFPQSRTKGLTDSEFKNPKTGATIGISSKGGKGANASVGNLYATIKKLKKEDTQKILTTYATVVGIIEKLATSNAKEGPLVLGEQMGLITPEVGQEVRRYLKINTANASQLSPDAAALFKSFGSKADSVGYSVGLVLLANVAKKLAAKINTDPSFSKACLALLNQSSIVQVYSTIKVVKGKDVAFTGFRSVYPPNYSGTVKADAGKNYTSTQVKGKITFAL